MRFSDVQSWGKFGLKVLLSFFFLEEGKGKVAEFIKDGWSIGYISEIFMSDPLRSFFTKGFYIFYIL